MPDVTEIQMISNCQYKFLLWKIFLSLWREIFRWGVNSNDTFEADALLSISVVFPPCHCWLSLRRGTLHPSQGKQNCSGWCIFFVAFMRENCHWQITLETRIGITIQFSIGRTTEHIVQPSSLSISTVRLRKHFNVVWLSFVQSITFSPPPPSFPASLVGSMHTITVLL